MPRRRFHPFWLALALVLLSWGGKAWVRTPPSEHEGSVSNPASIREAKTQPRPQRKNSSKAAVMIPVYPTGSLLVKSPKPHQPPKKKTRPKQESKSTKAVASRTGGKQSSPPSPGLDGERPSLSVSYDNTIGIERYLEISERVGRLFALIRQNGGMAVGPEISLRRNVVLPKNDAVMATLATKRPYIVRDPGFRARMAGLSLPPGARPESVIFFFTKQFDAVLWDVIGKNLSKQGRQLKDIDHIEGRYIRNGTAVFLKLDTAMTRKDGNHIRLGGKIRVTL
jgi:hypothetical protein